MAEYFYLTALSLRCHAVSKVGLPEDIYVTPCGGTKLIGHLASLFLGQEVRPLVLLDGDDAGRVRRDALMKEMYVGYESGIVMLDEALGRSGEEVEVEDILGEAIVLPAVKAVIGKSLSLTDADRKAGSLPNQIKAAAKRKDVELPDGWKASVAIELVSSWAEHKTTLSKSVLDAAARLFTVIEERFDAGLSDAAPPAPK